MKSKINEYKKEKLTSIRKKLRLIVTAFLIFNYAFLISQTFPYGINYQAVARDANGNAKSNQQVPVQFTIYQHSSSGTMAYQERQVLTTNAMGQFNAILGAGAPVTPYNTTSFSQLNWGADSTFLKVEINSNTSFTGTFSQVGNTTKFQSVPYALYSMATKLKAPTVQTFTAGSGTYITPAGVLYIEIEMVGGGGGGGASGSSTVNGGTGGTTSFGTSLLTATGGSGGQTDGGGAGTGGIQNGGTATVNSPATQLIALQGASGAPPASNTTSGGAVGGGSGGASPFGGAGAGGFANTTTGVSANSPTAGITNSGSGGGAAGGGSVLAACGGAAGGYIKAMITSPLSSYSYSVGAGGVGATGGQASGAVGGSGIIIVKEYYQ